MSASSRAERESDLVSYYDNEVRSRASRELPVERVARRSAFLELLAGEGRTSVLEIGCGPGRDGEALAAAGLVYTGVDLAPNSVAACRALGLDARVASVLDLPFEDASFDAGWTMSTLLHIADSDLDDALSEITRVLRPGAPLALGLWGDTVGGEHHWQDSRGFGPPRFFASRTDDSLLSVLRRHGSVEQWQTWPGGDGLHYQWALLRTTA